MSTFLQEYTDTVAELLGLDVTILEENGRRISGTGIYKNLIGQPAPKGSFFETILDTGKPGMIFETKKSESQCKHCMFIEQCQELATLGCPIFKRDKVVGVIGVVGFSYAQKETIIKGSSQLLIFLKHVSTLLEHGLLLDDFRSQGECHVQEQRVESLNKPTFKQMIGNHPSLSYVLSKARKVLHSPSTILIQGESGTGKEVLAQSIHYESTRKQHPFVAVNCAAIPENLLESELFGYEGGAFTGSKREGQKGKFQLAHQGTIFLDEIGDLPLSLQPKLLRVLQEKTIEPLGADRPTHVDVRVIAATNKNLEAMVEKGEFREDLYYRIHVIPLKIPPLRDRKDDIILYIRHFINKYGTLLNKEIAGIDIGLEQWLLQYDWPGNIRQLENVVEYMVNMAENVILGLHDLPDDLVQRVMKLRSFDSKSLKQMLLDHERDILQQYLKKDTFQDDKEKLAQVLQISLSSLYRKLEKYQLL